jgi:cytosine/adenosine deaminase-related metal-dependent hydrolase
MHDKWKGGADGCIQVWFGPRPPGGCSSALFREMMTAPNERGMGATVHMAEVREDVEYLRNTFGMSPIE